MFTGIIRQTAVVKGIIQDSLVVDLGGSENAPGNTPNNALKNGLGNIPENMEKAAAEIKIGDSLSVNGICLTVVKKEKNEISFDFMPETARKTTLANWHSGQEVNLEKGLLVGERLDGHFVSGHVDGVAKLIKVTPEKNARILYFETDQELLKYLAPKGSVAIDGISLTVINQDKFKRLFWVGIIPHTFQTTNLKHLKPGDRVNVETDLLAKYARN